MTRLPLLLALMLSGCVGDTSVEALERRALPLFYEEARTIEKGGPEAFFCLALNRDGRKGDPPANIVALLDEEWEETVLPTSACRIDDDSLVRSDAVEGSGEILTVGDFDCQEGRGCFASVSFYVANMGAGGTDVTMQRTFTGWRIERSNIQWIS